MVRRVADALDSPRCGRASSGGPPVVARVGHDGIDVREPPAFDAEPRQDRSSITLADHVDAICEAVTGTGQPVVLAVHSGAGVAGYRATDRIPEQIAAMVYVDTGPATGALNPDFTGDELPLPTPGQLEEEENLDGLTAEQLETFRRRAVPQPGAALRDAPTLATMRGWRFRPPSYALAQRPPSTRVSSSGATRSSVAWRNCVT